MKGYDEFASGLRLKPEPAMQNWWVATPEHGVTRAGALFLVDERIWGGRHALGGATELYTLLPDLACYGKALGNGAPTEGVGRGAEGGRYRCS
jgi:glutamate-1-semialdehyde aminotransferase